MGSGIPEGYPTVSPYLLVESAERVIEFLVRSFDGALIQSVPHAAGGIRHAEVRIGDSVVMMGEQPESAGMPANVHVYVDDVDARYERALSAGGVPISPPRDQDYGDRTAGVQDPAGNIWWIGTRRPE